MRKIILSSLRSFAGREEESGKIVEIIRNHRKWKEAETVLAFSPLSTEPDISPLLSDERILLPYITRRGEMEFGKGETKRNRLGFLEPICQSPSPYKSALMLVPLVAVDKSGMRLGRGKGFYDKYIAENRGRIYTIGLALSPSMVDQVPFDSHDEKLDEVICIKESPV